jgi:hypothetical protein
MKSFTLFFVLFVGLVVTSCGGGGEETSQTGPQTGSNNPNDRFNCPALKTSNIGINQNPLNYYGSQIAFADLMKMSSGWQRPWGSPNAAVPLQLDSDGYPTVIDLDNNFVTIIHDDDWGRDITNDNVYVLLYDGEGTFNISINNTIIDQTPGRIVYQLNAQGRTLLYLNSTNPANHARNIRFVALADESTYATQPFRQIFLDNWGSFPTFRYMDWLRTNNSTVAQWSDRALVTDSRQSTNAGVAYEYIIQLSNDTQTNPWINIPHMADDNYVLQLATLFRDTLDPNLTVYIEYTNEAWNSIFSQTGYMNTMATNLGLPNGRNYYSQRTAEVMDIWSNIYTGIPTQRYVRVLGTHFANSWITNQLASWGNASTHVDAVAVGPYFGGTMGRVNNVDATLAMTSAELAQHLLDVEVPNNKTQMIAQKAVADTYGLRLVAYEGGQHLVGVGTHPTLGYLVNYQPLTDLLIATNREPVMKDVYLQYLSNWQEVSGDLMLLFNAVGEYSRYGSWGLLEFSYQTVSASPKASAVYESVCGTP